MPVLALLVQPLQPQALPVLQALPPPRAVPRAVPLRLQAQRRSPAIWLGDSQGGSRPGPPRAASASAHCTGTLAQQQPQRQPKSWAALTR